MRLIDADALLKRMQDYYGIVADMEKIMVETIFVDGEGGEFVIQTAKTTLEEIEDFFKNTPTIDPVKHGDAVSVVRCKECKHRPIDTGGHNYGQDLFFPDEDNVCPCKCDDQWYSWMPRDDWFCANGERSEDD